MRKIFFFVMSRYYLILLFFFSSLTQAWVEPDSSMKLTSEVQKILDNASTERSLVSANGKVKVVHYKSNLPVEEGEIADEVLKVAFRDDILWLYGGYGSMFINFDFIKGGNKLIVEECNNIVCGSFIVGLADRKITILGGGSYQVVDKERIKLSGSKRYDENGAFWIDKLVDYEGGLIRIISSGNCVPLEKILYDYSEEKYPKLKQSMSECIHVRR